MSELRKELARKAIHFTGVSYIPAYLYLGREALTFAIAAALSFALFFEFLRLRLKLFNFVSREYEKGRVAAYVYFATAALLITIFFPRDACFVAIAAAIVGDGLAGIVKRANFNLAASGVMFLSSYLFVVLANLADPLPAAVAVAAATAVERIDRIGRFYIEDNFSVPVVSAFVYSLVKYIFL